MGVTEVYTLTLNDGTVLDAGFCGTGTMRDGSLWIRIIGKGIAECAAIFSDPEKTSHMVWNYAIGTETYDGYTDLMSLMVMGNDTTRIEMGKVTANEQ